MKKIFCIISSTVAIAFALQSCNGPKVDTAQEWARVDSMANVKVMSYQDSLKLVCMNNVMTMAQAKADSMMQASMKKTGGKPKPKPTAPPKPEPGTGKLGEKLNENSGGKLKDKLNTNAPTGTTGGGKLKDKMNTTPTPTTTPK